MYIGQTLGAYMSYVFFVTEDARIAHYARGYGGFACARSEQNSQPERVALSADSVIHIRHCEEPLREKNSWKKLAARARNTHNEYMFDGYKL